MKKITKLFSLAAVAGMMATGCDKVDDLPNYAMGTTPVLTSSATSIAPAVADSSKTVLTLSWSNPKYSNDSLTTKYVVEIDSIGRNFTKAYTKTITGATTANFTAKELNDALLGFEGIRQTIAYDFDVRVTSSYGNNNEQYHSNTTKLNLKMYPVKSKVQTPATGKLFIVGDATTGGWTNPVPVPSQEFTKVDSLTYTATLKLNANAGYLLLPLNGDWTNKYSVANDALVGLSAGGDFGYNLASNFPSPKVTGNYKITLDFLRGKFSVKPQ